jgi:hypothetical protein
MQADQLMEMMDGDTKESGGAVPATSLWGSPAADGAAAQASGSAGAQNMSAVPATSLRASLSEAASGNSIAAPPPHAPEHEEAEEEDLNSLPQI